MSALSRENSSFDENFSNKSDNGRLVTQDVAAVNIGAESKERKLYQRYQVHMEEALSSIDLRKKDKDV